MANEALYDEQLDIAPDDEYEEAPQANDDDDDDDDDLAEKRMPAESQWHDAADEQPDNVHYAAEEPEPLDALDQLPMALTLRCGNLNLTLGELRRIAAGSVVEVNGVTPGHATLCHGERVVAEGELVDVEGRLGLQITRMATPA
jgi:type III secretion protein Q